MIVDLPGTTTSQVSKTLVTLREEGGAVALGRVLTLVIATNGGEEEAAIEAANEASREHPMRVIVLAPAGGEDDAPRLDAEVRIGGDAGASEVVVLRPRGAAGSNEESLVTGLLLPDAPVVVWWTGAAPEVVASSSLGRIATRRITDASEAGDARAALRHLSRSYTPGDTDFAWTRLTLWRAQLAAVLDQPPYETIEAVDVAGAGDSPSTLLLAAWLSLRLDVPVHYDLTRSIGSVGIRSVRLHRASGVIELEREAPHDARLTQPGQPPQDVSLPRRTLTECLAEELRRLDPDDTYGEVLRIGLDLLEHENDGADAP